VPSFMAWYERELAHFPLWCVPYRRTDYRWLNPQFLAGIGDELFIDLAIYGLEQKDGRNVHALIEQKLLELHGGKTLISHNYYSERDFWTTFNHAAYDDAKKRVDPRNVFRDLYAKTCRAARGLT